MQELNDIKAGVNTLTTEFQEYKTAAAEKYVTKDEHKGVIQWIVGAYIFIASTAVTTFFKK